MSDFLHLAVGLILQHALLSSHKLLLFKLVGFSAGEHASSQALYIQCGFIPSLLPHNRIKVKARFYNPVLSGVDEESLCLHLSAILTVYAG